MKKSLLVSLMVVFILSLFGAESVEARRRKKEEKVEKKEVYTGPKKRIAVTDFENKVGGVWWNDRSWKVGEGMAEMLITALVESGRFIVVERKELDDVIKEQDLGTEGRISKATAAKVGKILGAQILVRGAVTELEESKSGKAGAIGYKGIVLGGGQVRGYVATEIRLVDSTTGQVLDSHRSIGESKKGGLAIGVRTGDVTFGGGGFKKTALGEAVNKAIRDMVDYIMAKMEEVPWQGRIVMVKEGKVYVNAGSRGNIKTGDTFDVYKPGEELIDPETGLSLGSEETKVGKIRVSSVKDKFSIATAVSGSGFARGYILRITQ
jgi:curli biogenesis system outer membrane secretion channel CsgG